MTRHTNSFDLIRHIAALLVFLSHHFALSGLKDPKFLTLDSYGYIGVIIFFSLSGFLVTKSFVRSESFSLFIEKRIRRVFPAIIACSFIITFIVCPFFYTGDFLTYFSDASTYKMFFDGSFLLGLKKAGIFQGFIYPNVINASLWTLPYEFLFYLTLGSAFILFPKNTASIVLLTLAITGAIYFKTHPTNFQFYNIRLDRAFLLMLSFSLGSLLAVTEKIWNKYDIKLIAIFIFIIFIASQYKRNDFYILGSLCICILTILICISIPDKLINGKFDFSYGIYIYSFPIQQVIINQAGLSFYQSMTLALLIILIISAASWFYVEKPFLHRDRLIN